MYFLTGFHIYIKKVELHLITRKARPSDRQQTREAHQKVSILLKILAVFKNWSFFLVELIANAKFYQYVNSNKFCLIYFFYYPVLQI